MRLTSPLVREYRRSAGPTPRLERVVAVGRAFLTVAGLLAIYLDPSQPTRLQAITYAVLLAYAGYSLAVVVFVHRSARLTEWHGRALHGLDIAWTATLTTVSEGPVSPFFLFFLFVVLASAYRWGFRETVGTSLLIIGIFLLQTAVAAAGPWQTTWLAPIDVEIDSAILRVAYLLLTGFLLGYLAEQDKQSRAELAAVADVTRQPQVSLGLGGSVAALARRLLSIFEAAAIDVVIHDQETGQTLLWQLHSSMRHEARGGENRGRLLDPSDRQTWLFNDRGRAWHAELASRRDELNVRRLEPGVWPLSRGSQLVPSALHADRSFRTLTAVNIGLPDEWYGRVYLFDIGGSGSLDRALHFLEDLADHITPALTNVFLTRRLRARAGAAERARVSRELHDGAIQALFGIEMKIEAIRRNTAAAPAAVRQELADVQELLRREVLALRELMQTLRPIELDSSDQLPDVLAALVERFRRDTGISARFVPSGARVAMHPSKAIEVVRIVQEALVNVRKHSRARNVMIRLSAENGSCTLVVEDDGQGFGFEGRLSGEDLDSRRIGPAIIKERARIAGGDLAVESTPGAGARLEVTFGGHDVHV
jgi:signal transduction histidine kinase